ncbi:PAQR family membrane homeostasis protein TrhA [Stieleria varia]|uniref:PAQR family membrane homeostasis protein TrhA n=1 Tax=Stieleria varia TaxID=2528005 RepID=UPI0018D223E9|nr:hemolysin III family protein [Stieleria varia]
MNSPDTLESSPLQRDGQEWLNTLTHGFAVALTLVAAVPLIGAAWKAEHGLAYACTAYITAVSATFLCSTLSHHVKRQPLRDTMRAWDQAMIYAMISGTYSPIVFRYLNGSAQVSLQVAIWLAAAVGIAAKLAFRHRINSVTTVSYLLLGWLPSIPLYGSVPRELGLAMLSGGIVYTLGVAVLVNDYRSKYLHAVWHVLVIFAASIHFYGIFHYVVGR